MSYGPDVTTAEMTSGSATTARASESAWPGSACSNRNIDVMQAACAEHVTRRFRLCNNDVACSWRRPCLDRDREDQRLVGIGEHGLRPFGIRHRSEPLRRLEREAEDPVVT